MIPSRFEQFTRCYGGGGGGSKVKPPKPPSPTTAAENVAKMKILDRQRSARGYSSTMLASLMPEENKSSFLKSLLGQ